MYRIIQIILVAIVCTISAFAQAEGLSSKTATITKQRIEPPKSALEKGNWEYLETKKGIKLYRKKVGNKGLFAVRGELTINEPVDKVASAVYDESRWTEWTKIASGKLLKLHPDNRKTVYQAFNLPFILSNRDVIYTFGVWKLPDGTTFISGKTEAGGESTGPETVGVRMKLVAGDWYMKPIAANKTRVTLEVLMDPRGSLPVWFVNIVQRDYPVRALGGLRRQTSKSDIKPFLPRQLTKLTR